ncbi:MAG: ABC transporter permease [Spirochaetes bacterium]|nr:ABC transporter permease [Spirochaetota bacterium]
MISIPSSIVLLLAWRNVWKNKRRTVLTLLTIMMGCAMIIFMKALQKGAWGSIIENAVSTNNGHIQIHETGFWENLGIDYAFIPDGALLSSLNSDSRIAAFSRRVYAAALVSHRDNTEGAMIEAVDPDNERSVTDLHTFILEGGRYLSRDDRTHIVIGETLAKNLNVTVGGTVSMISQGFDGSIAAENLTVAGLFRTGNPEYDNVLIVMPLTQAMDTFTMMNYINSIVVRLKDATDMDDVREDLRRRFGSARLEIMGWEELMPDMVEFINMKQVGTYIFQFIMMMLSAFGVLNTIQMSVYERIRELGIMLAIGTRPEQIRRMVLSESLLIAILGVVLGAALGSALSIYFFYNPIDYSSFSKQMSAYGITLAQVSARLAPGNVVSTSIIMLVLSIAFTIGPARRASRLNAIQAIRKL